MVKTKLCCFLYITSLLCVIGCSTTDNSIPDSQADTGMPLSKTEAETYAQQLIDEKVRTDMEASFRKQEITIGDKTMRLVWTVYDEKPDSCMQIKRLLTDLQTKK